MSEKHPDHEVNSTTNSSNSGEHTMTLPVGWKYKQLKIGKFRLPWYASPPTQLVLIAMVCFLCPGMFNALGGLGGGGQIDTHTADKANVALYSTFSVVGTTFYFLILTLARTPIHFKAAV